MRPGFYAAPHFAPPPIPHFGPTFGGINVGGHTVGGVNIGGQIIGGVNVGGYNMGGIGIGGHIGGGPNIGPNIGGTTIGVSAVGGPHIGAPHIGGPNSGLFAPCGVRMDPNLINRQRNQEKRDEKKNGGIHLGDKPKKENKKKKICLIM